MEGHFSLLGDRDQATRYDVPESMRASLSPEVIALLEVQPMYYVKDETTGKIIGTNDRALWVKRTESNAHWIARDTWDEGSGRVLVSTVFLGIDHGFGFTKNPILWETMVFGGPHDAYQERYDDEATAVIRHAEIVTALKAGRAPGHADPDPEAIP